MTPTHDAMQGEVCVLASGNRFAQQAATDLRRQLAAALSALDKKRAEGLDVHEARKHIKRARAMLRLMRPAIGRSSYEHEDETLRAAARELNAHRDADVLLRGCDRIGRHMMRSSPKADVAPLRATLARARKAVRHPSESRAIPRARVLLRQCQSRGRYWDVADEWSLLAKGLKTTYRKGRTALHAVRHAATAEHLHAWRKQAKYTWHQLEAIRGMAPERIDRMTRRFRRLSDYLGDDHDLAILRVRARDRSAGLDKSSSRALVDTIDRRRGRLQAQALDLGQRLYRDSPREFMARLAQFARSAPSRPRSAPSRP